MFLAHRVLHPSTAVTTAFWCRLASSDDELVVARGDGLEAYGCEGGSLRLKRRWGFERCIAAAAPAERRDRARDAVVLAFAPAQLAVLDVDDARADGGLRTLALRDLATVGGAGASQKLRGDDAAKRRPLRAAVAERDWPLWLGASADGGCAAVRCLGRVVAAPLPVGVRSGAEPFFCDQPLRGKVARLLAFRGDELFVAAADAAGDAPRSTSLVALGLDRARRSAFVRWRVDELAAAPRGLIPLSRDDGASASAGGGALLLFRHSAATVRPGGAVAATALNGFAGDDWGPSDVNRHRLAPNAPPLALDVSAGAYGAELQKGVCLLGLPGAIPTWVADCRGASGPRLRPLAAGISATVFAANGDRVFLGGGLDDGVLCSVKVGEDEDKQKFKKPKFEQPNQEAVDLYGPKTVDASKSEEMLQSVSLVATDALLSLGAVLDCAFAARVGHRWPFQPQREGDARRVAAEARASNRAELVTCSGPGDGARGHLCCLGNGVRPPCVATCALGSVTRVFGGLRWRGPFRGAEETSTEFATRDVVVVANESGPPRWFLFDGAKFSEHALDVEAQETPLVGVIPTADPLDAKAAVYLAYADGWLALADGAGAGAGAGGGPFDATLCAVAGSPSTGFVAACSDGAARELCLIDNGKGLRLGDHLIDATAICVVRCPSHLFFSSGAVRAPDGVEGWPEAPPFDERAFLYDAAGMDVKREKGRTCGAVVGVDAAGDVRARRLRDVETTTAVFEHGTAGHATLGIGAAPPSPILGASIIVRKCGPSLALDQLGCWVLGLITNEGDVLIYWHDSSAGCWRRLKHEFIGRPPGGTNSDDKYALSPFEDVESRSGIFVSADRPALVLCERGAPSVVALADVASEEAPPETEGPAGFAPLPTVRGFLLVRRVASKGSANFYGAVCSGLGNVILASSTAKLTTHKAPLDKASPYRVKALGSPPNGVDAAPSFACLCAAPFEPTAARIVDEEAEPSTEPPLNNEQWPVECLSDTRLGGVPPQRHSNRHEVRLVTGLGWRTTQRCLLNDGERGACLDVVRLAKPCEEEGRSMRATYVAVGTSIVTGYGEDAPSRGRILLLEVDYAPVRRKSRTTSGRGARAGHLARLRPSHAKALRGVCSGLAQVQEHLVCSIVNRVEVYMLKGVSDLIQIATHHAPHYVVSLKVAKNYVLYADVYQSAQLLFWRDRDRQLWPLAKDVDRDGVADVACADFVVDSGELAGAHALGIVLGDGDRVRLLQYAPLGSQNDRGGSKLLHRADFSVGVDVQSIARHRVVEPDRRAAARGEPAPRTKAFACVYGGRDGAVGALIPVDERIFRRLGALQGVMGNALRHEAGLHPDKHRLASPQSRNVLDGQLLFGYASLDYRFQEELAIAVGTERAVVLDNLLELDLSTSFF